MSLAESSVAVSEEDGLVNITLMLTGAHSVPFTVTVATLSGTAIGITHVISVLYNVGNLHVSLNKLTCILG